MSLSTYNKHPPEIYCSFCRRAQNRVQHLIAQGGVYICNGCIHQFKHLLKQNPDQQDSTCGCSHNVLHCTE